MSAIERLKKDHAQFKLAIFNGLETQGGLINGLHIRIQHLERPFWKKILRMK